MFQEVLTAIGSMLGIAVATALLFLAKNAWNWFQSKLSVDQQAALGAAAEKVLTLGIMKNLGTIAIKGWDSPEVKEELIRFGVRAIGEKFPDVKQYIDGIAKPLHGQSSDAILRDVLTRALPAAASLAASSPVTPPAPPAPETLVAATAAGVVAAQLTGAAPTVPEAVERAGDVLRGSLGHLSR